jgi:hypothetical protein
LERFKFDYAAAPIAFVGNTDVDGVFAAGLTADRKPVSIPHSLWAPGTRIPRLGWEGTWRTSYGANYAAAAAAAVAANILAAGFKGAPADLLGLLRRTSRQSGRQPEVKIIDQAAALTALAAPLPAPEAADGK